MNTNIVVLNGKVASDVKSGKTSNGSTWANFRISVSKKVKDKWVAQFFAVCAFGKTADEMVRMKKGFQVMIEGELQVRQYEKDNVKKEQYQVQAYSLMFQPKHNESVADVSDFDPGFDSDDEIGF